MKMKIISSFWFVENMFYVGQRGKDLVITSHIHAHLSVCALVCVLQLMKGKHCSIVRAKHLKVSPSEVP